MIDVTSTILISGNHGKYCPGNGLNYNDFENLIECCYSPVTELDCLHCKDNHCPHAVKQ